jgi:hypothetical protein
VAVWAFAHFFNSTKPHQCKMTAKGINIIIFGRMDTQEVHGHSRWWAILRPLAHVQ